MVALRVAGELVAVKVSPERPHRVHASGFVGWVGNVVPAAERRSPFLRCEGEGAVFVALPGGRANSGRPETTLELNDSDLVEVVEPRGRSGQQDHRAGESD
jgi:hypothetical protein